MNTKRITELWNNPIVKVFLLALFLVSLIVFLKPLFLDYYPDFACNYYSPLTLLQHDNPYLGGKGFFTPQVYPPSVFVFFFPFILFPFGIAEKIYTVISIASILSSTVVMFKLLKIQTFSKIAIILFILLFNFFPEKFTLGMGQINNIVLLFVTLFLYFYMKKKDFLAGLFLAVAIVLKLTPALFLIYLLIDKRWKTLLATIVSLGIVGGAVVLIIPPSINLYFLKIVLPGLVSSWKGDYYNQALSGFLMREVVSLPLRQLLKTVLDAIILLAGLFTIWKYGKGSEMGRLLSISLLMTVSLIINTFSWQHHFVWLLIPFLAMFVYIHEHHLSWKYYLLLGTSYLLVASNLKNPSAVPVLLQSHVLYGALLLYGLNIYLLFNGRIIAESIFEFFKNSFDQIINIIPLLLLSRGMMIGFFLIMIGLVLKFHLH